MISPSAECSEFYKKYKIKATSIPIGAGEDSGVYIKTEIISPYGKPNMYPPYYEFKTFPPFDGWPEFKSVLNEQIQLAYPVIDGYIASLPGGGDYKPGGSVELPDPLQSDADRINPTYRPPSWDSGVYNPSGATPGSDISGAPSLPQVSYGVSSIHDYKHLPFNPNDGLNPGQVKARGPKKNTRRHRKGIGRNENPLDVAMFMSSFISTIDANRISYVDTNSGNWSQESRSSTFDRLLGLHTDQVPPQAIYEDVNKTTFVRHIYHVVNDKSGDISVDGQSLIGREISIRNGEEYAKYIDVLEGDKLQAIRYVAKNKTGSLFMPKNLAQSLAVSNSTLEALDGTTKTQITKMPSATSDSEFWSRLSFDGVVWSPDKYNEVGKSAAGTTFTAKKGSLDYSIDITDNYRNNIYSSACDMSGTLSECVLGEVARKMGTAGTFSQIDDKREEHELTRRREAKIRYSGTTFGLFTDINNESANNIPAQAVAAKFAACHAIVDGTCKQCANFVGGSGSEFSQLINDGSATINASMSCLAGYTQPGGLPKQPGHNCGSMPVKFKLNKETTDVIQEWAKDISRGGFEVYDALAKQERAKLSKVNITGSPTIAF